MRCIRWVGVLVIGVLAGCGGGPARFQPVGSDGGAQDRAPAVNDATPEVGGADRAPIRAMEVVLGEGVPADAPMRFEGAEDGARAPSFVYPADRTIVPPNMPGFEVHFMPGAGNDLFELSFTGDTAAVRHYTRCAAVGGGCVFALDEAAFARVAMAARAGGAVRVGLRATSLRGGGVGRAAPITLGVTQTNLRGGVYYWAANSGNILRYEFGRSGVRPEVYITGGGPFNCVGCHALSRDGARIAVGRFIPGPAQAQMFDVVSRAPVGGGFGSNFGSFSPDNARYLTSDGVRLALLDGATAQPVPGLPGETLGSMPDWSPSGALAVFSRTRGPAPPFFGSPGHDAPADLLVMAYASGAFGAPTSLVSSMGENNYYPSFSPDGQWVLFNRAARNSYNAIDARMWAVRAAGGGAPVALATANGEGDLGNSWPKWAPFVEMYSGELTEPLMWITVSSKRDYGLRLRQQSRAADARVAQLWMAAFRPGQGARDPSAPAFWLPFQDLSAGNHIAQWTAEVRRRDCMMTFQCANGEYCSGGRCVGAPP